MWRTPHAMVDCRMNAELQSTSRRGTLKHFPDSSPIGTQSSESPVARSAPPPGFSTQPGEQGCVTLCSMMRAEIRSVRCGTCACGTISTAASISSQSGEAVCSTMRAGIRSCESNSPRRMKRLLPSMPTVDTLQKLQKKSLNLKTSHVAKHLPTSRQKPALRPRTAELSLYCIFAPKRRVTASTRTFLRHYRVLSSISIFLDIQLRFFGARWALVG